jgi:hypothetical protein
MFQTKYNAAFADINLRWDLTVKQLFWAYLPFADKEMYKHISSIQVFWNYNSDLKIKTVGHIHIYMETGDNQYFALTTPKIT